MRWKQSIVRTDSRKQEGLQQRLLGLKGTHDKSRSAPVVPQHLSTYLKSLQLKGWASLPPPSASDPYITSVTLGYGFCLLVLPVPVSSPGCAQSEPSGYFLPRLHNKALPSTTPTTVTSLARIFFHPEVLFQKMNMPLQFA